ncbi:Hsp90 family protein [Leishmania donovani]|uniref:Hsp90 family protein n=1 Tax=Leishmania donovani TaxID=5661 RepID=A0A504X157_LEIDO|nr:Hsp90 family protein [Leishmania donovani]
MKAEQKSIYYITGDSKKKLELMQQVKDFEDKKFACLTKEGTMKEVLGDKVEKVTQIMRNQALRDSSMAQYMITTGREGLVFLLFDTSLLTSGFQLEDPPATLSDQRMIKLGLSLDEEEEAAEATVAETAPAEVTAGTSSMEQVD